MTMLSRLKRLAKATVRASEARGAEVVSGARICLS